MFATEMSTVRVQEPFVLYRAYLWFPLLGALAPMALMNVNAKAVTLLAVPLVGVLMALSWNRLATMTDSLHLWNDAAKLLSTGEESGAGRIYYNRALALSSAGRKQEALVDLDHVVKLHPKLAPVYYARAQVAFDLKRYEEAMLNLNESITLNRMQSAAYYARAQTLRRMGREDEALQDLRVSCEMKDIMGCYALEQYSRSTKRK
jgi:protein O-mannosyl-transferase